MKMLKKKEDISTNLKAKLVLMFILLLILFASIIWKAVSAKTSETFLETETEETKETETEILISNLDEFATPLLEGDAILLEERLEMYVLGMGKEISGAEIFYVVVCQSENNAMDFYVKLFPDEQIVKLQFQHDNGEVVAEACEYTEEEIRNEIWNEGAPAIRDMQ